MPRGGRHSASGPSARYGVTAARQKGPQSGIPRKLIAAAAVVVVIVIVLVVVHPFSRPAEQQPAASDNVAAVQDDQTGQADQAAQQKQEHEWFPTPYIAESEGVKLHCAVSVEDLTEILIHNASYSYAEPLKTKLKEATNVDVMDAHGTGRKALEQPTGNKWLTGEFIRTFRSNNGGPKMSAIDCGAAPGTQVYSPVTGTVKLVRAYKLYNDDDYDDFEIHIQPEGHPELDVVLIHLTNPQVERGSKVEGGVTPIAKVRDVYAYIGEAMQLKKYTAKGDNGNHTHIQVNNANDSEYHGLDEDRIENSVPLKKKK